MADGWGAALQAGVNGYFRGAQMTEDYQDRKDERVWRDEQRAELRRQQQEQQAQRQALKDAAQPIALVEGAGGYVKPPTMDDRDVGQADNFKPMAAVVGGQLKQDGMAAPADGGLQRGGFSVAGKSFSDRAAAQAEVESQNSTDAVSQRMANVYLRSGNPEKSMALQHSALQTKVAKFQLDEATEKRMNEAFDRKLFSIQTPDQLAQTLSGSSVVGGAKLSAAIAPDGKTFQLSSIGPDGTSAPVGGAMPTDGKGLQSVISQFAQGMSTVQRLTFLQHDRAREEDRGDKKESRDETKRHNMAMEGLAGRKIDGRGAGGSGGAGGSRTAGADGAPSFDPLSDFDSKQARKGSMDQAIEEAKSAGVGKDGKPIATEQQIAKRAQAIYGAMRDAAASENSARERRRVFAREASLAETPQQVEALRVRARQSGFSDQEVAAIDPRFKPPAAPASAAKSPATSAAPVAIPAPAAPQDIQPVPGSRVAQMRERNAQVQQQRAVQQQADVQAAVVAANEVLKSKDMRQAYQVLQASGFSSLPMALQQAVSNLANGR